VLELIRIAWHRWHIIGEVFSNLVGRTIAVLFYFTVFVPFAVAARLFTDPLRIRTSQARWLDRAPVGSTLDDARRQF
jgi:hypothetical protein